MNNYSDVWLTPDDVATRLQLNVETVYRWLRAGKLRGQRLSHKAWRLSEIDLACFLRKQNRSELLFEEYVAAYGLGTLEREPHFPRSSKKVDYKLARDGDSLWFEVKEFADNDVLFAGPVGEARGGAFDPHLGARAKIAKANEKFRGYDGECCSLVLFNEAANLVDICTPRVVYGAMFGVVGFRVFINPESGVEVGAARMEFTHDSKAKMIHPHNGTAQNTKISSVIALERLCVGHADFRARVAKEELKRGLALPLAEQFSMLELQRDDYERRVLRVIVFENPFAQRPLPRTIFNGPFDERWGEVDGAVGPIFAGPELLKLRQRDHELGLDLNPFQKAAARRAADDSAMPR